MGIFKKTIVPIIITGIWINISETVRWMLLVESYWLDKYKDLNLTFPGETINMIVWMLWGFLHATVIFILSRRYNLLQTTFLSWFVAFVMMWVIVWNVGVLPTDMLWFNAPLSLLEAFIGAYICIKFFKPSKAST